MILTIIIVDLFYMKLFKLFKLFKKTNTWLVLTK